MAPAHRPAGKDFAMTDITRRQGLKLGLSAAAGGALALAAGRAMAATHAVAIQGFAFVPAELAVAVGDTVVFTNLDRAPHTATALNGSFDTGNLRRDETGEVTIAAAGVIDYKCSIHPSMKAKITAS